MAAEAGEERDRGIDQADGLGDHAGAPAEPGQPMALPRVVALDAVRLIPAHEELPRRDQLGVGRPVVGAVQPRVPAPLLQAGEEPLEGRAIATAAFPVNQSA